MSLEGAAISDGRTGWYALVCIDLLLKGKHKIEVFMFGAGKIAEVVILSLDFGAGDRIKWVTVVSCHGNSNHKLVEKLGSEVKFDLVAVDSRELLPSARFVITATSANKSVFELRGIALGVDELPNDYFPS